MLPAAVDAEIQSMFQQLRTHLERLDRLNEPDRSQSLAQATQYYFVLLYPHLQQSLQSQNHPSTTAMMQQQQRPQQEVQDTWRRISTRLKPKRPLRNQRLMEADAAWKDERPDDSRWTKDQRFCIIRAKLRHFLYHSESSSTGFHPYSPVRRAAAKK